MVIYDVLLGLCLLLAGRKLFWLAVGILGFVVGMDYAAVIMPEASGLMIFLAALLLGVLGSVLAVAFEWVAILFIGFLGGGYFVTQISLYFAADPQQISNLLFLMGGVVGALVMIMIFDVALITISSLVGALLITRHLAISEALWLLSFILCAMAGIIAQYYGLTGPDGRHLNNHHHKEVTT